MLCTPIQNSSLEGRSKNIAEALYEATRRTLHENNIYSVVKAGQNQE